MNADNQRQVEEEGMDGVQVYLKTVSQDSGVVEYDSLKTYSIDGESGQFLFDDVLPGRYELTVLPEEGLTWSGTLVDSSWTASYFQQHIAVEAGYYNKISAGFTPIPDPNIETSQPGFKQHTKKVDRITAFPNPVYETLEVASDFRSPFTLKIATALGTPIHEQQCDSGACTVNMTHLPSGIYFVIIEHDHERFIKRISKK